MYCFGVFGLLVERFVLLDWLFWVIRGFALVGWCCVVVLLLDRCCLWLIVLLCVFLFLVWWFVLWVGCSEFLLWLVCGLLAFG